MSIFKVKPWALVAFTALLLSAVVIGILSFRNSLYVVQTDSMLPAFAAGDVVLTNRAYFDSSELDRLDIVLLRMQPPNGSRVETIQRIVGLPGDMVKLSSDGVVVNDAELSFYDSEGFDLSVLTTSELLIKENEYFLLGDNLRRAYDSRYTGTVMEENLLGKVLFKVGQSEKAINNAMTIDSQ